VRGRVLCGVEVGGGDLSLMALSVPFSTGAAMRYVAGMIRSRGYRLYWVRSTEGLRLVDASIVLVNRVISAHRRNATK
jgi:hypothetical protein